MIGWLAVVTPPPDDKVSPGIAGFLAIFGVALATVLLIRSMVKHLRKVQYSPDPAAEDQTDASPPASGPAGTPKQRPAGPKAGPRKPPDAGSDPRRSPPP